jgi:hypothetical protein
LFASELFFVMIPKNDAIRVHHVQVVLQVTCTTILLQLNIDDNGDDDVGSVQSIRANKAVTVKGLDSYTVGNMVMYHSQPCLVLCAVQLSKVTWLVF